MPASTRRPTIEGTGRYGALLNSFLWVSDSDTMTDDAIRGMRRSYAADISVIDQAVGDMVEALQRRGILDNTWIIYTSDHGEMGGNHRMMSKCVLYEPAVRVPLIIRPPGGRPAAVVDSLVEHLDVPATVREIAGAPDLALSEGRSLLTSVDDPATPPARSLTVSENWGFAAFETERYKLVVDEDAVEPCQLFDLFRGCRGRPRPPARSGGSTRRRGAHGDPRPSVLPHAAGSAHPEHLHRRVRLNDTRPSPARAGPPSAPRQRSGCGGPPPRCGATGAGSRSRHAGPA